MGSNVTPNITRSSDCFRTVPPIVAEVTGDALCMTWRLSSLGLTRFQYHSPKITLTLPRSRISDSATVTLTPGDGTTHVKVESSISITDQLIFQNKRKALKSTEGTKIGQKHCPAAILKEHQPVYSDNHPP